MKVTDRMAQRFRDNEAALSDYVGDEINLAQLYDAIGSPVESKWVDYQDPDPHEYS